MKHHVQRLEKRTKITDIKEYIPKRIWKCAEHIASMKDNSWADLCTEWPPSRGTRSKGRPSGRQKYDIVKKEGATWSRTALDRLQWRALMEGYILQWTDNA